RCYRDWSSDVCSSDLDSASEPDFVLHTSVTLQVTIQDVDLHRPLQPFYPLNNFFCCWRLRSMIFRIEQRMWIACDVKPGMSPERSEARRVGKGGRYVW